MAGLAGCPWRSQSDAAAPATTGGTTMPATHRDLRVRSRSSPSRTSPHGGHRHPRHRRRAFRLRRGPLRPRSGKVTVVEKM
ncbi:MAG: hypothetical protein ACLSDQ_11670 [Adlercreutzia equolifaciens]